MTSNYVKWHQIDNLCDILSSHKMSYIIVCMTSYGTVVWHRMLVNTWFQYTFHFAVRFVSGICGSYAETISALARAFDVASECFVKMLEAMRTYCFSPVFVFTCTCAFARVFFCTRVFFRTKPQTTSGTLFWVWGMKAHWQLLQVEAYPLSFKPGGTRAGPQAEVSHGFHSVL